MSWAELGEVYRENRETYEHERSTPPVACPEHGDPLEENADGVLHCPMGHVVPDN